MSLRDLAKRPMRGKIAGLAGDFAQAFIIQKLQRSIVEGFNHQGTLVPGLRQVFEAFTPEGLERLALSGNSLIDLWLSTLPASLQGSVVQEIQGRGIDAELIVKSLDWQEILREVARTCPKQAGVADKHPQWYARENGRAEAKLIQMLRGV